MIDTLLVTQRNMPSIKLFDQWPFDHICKQYIWKTERIQVSLISFMAL